MAIFISGCSIVNLQPCVWVGLALEVGMTSWHLPTHCHWDAPSVSQVPVGLAAAPRTGTAFPCSVRLSC